MGGRRLLGGPEPGGGALRSRGRGPCRVGKGPSQERSSASSQPPSNRRGPALGPPEPRGQGAGWAGRWASSSRPRRSSEGAARGGGGVRGSREARGGGCWGPSPFAPVGTGRPQAAEWAGAGPRFSSPRGVCSERRRRGLPTAAATGRGGLPPGPGEGRPGHRPAPSGGRRAQVPPEQVRPGPGQMLPRSADPGPPRLRASHCALSPARGTPRPPSPRGRDGRLRSGWSHGRAPSCVCAADRTGDPGVRGHAWALPRPPQAQPGPRALGAVTGRRLRRREVGGRAGEAAGEEEPGWRAPRAAGTRIRGPRGGGAGAAARGRLGAGAGAVHGAARRAQRPPRSRPPAAVLPAPPGLADARRTAAGARRVLGAAADRPEP